MRRLVAYGLSVTLLAASDGCVTARLNQFHSFAEEGRAYVEASGTVLDQAGFAAIDADSLIALSGREALKTAEARRQYILVSDQALRKRLLLLRQIGEHGKLLQSYFESLAALSDSNAPPGLEAAAEGLYGSILQLSPTLQNGAFKVVADDLIADLTASLQLQETQEVIEPYAASANVPARWVSRRQDILEARVAAEGAQSAVGAAARLRADFVALVENRLSAAAIIQSIRSIHSIQDLKDKIQKAGL